MLKRDESKPKLEVYECCGATRDPGRQGRFKFAGTDTWLCLKCFDAETLKREATNSEQRATAGAPSMTTIAFDCEWAGILRGERTEALADGAPVADVAPGATQTP